MRTLLTYLVCLLLFTACKKQENPHTETSVNKTPTQISFNNQMDAPLTLAIYDNIEDFKYSRNPVYQSLLDEDSIIYWPCKDPKAEYYIDWYSADYKLSGWNQPTIIPAIPLRTTAPDGWNYYFSFLFQFLRQNDKNAIVLNKYAYLPSYLRRVILDSNRPSTTWKVASVHNRTTGAMEAPTGAHKDVSLSFSKDMGFRAMIADTAGNKVTAYSGIYTVEYNDYDSLNIVRLMDTTDNYSHFWTAGLISKDFMTIRSIPIPDTIYFDDYTHQYKLFRQQ